MGRAEAYVGSAAFFLIAPGMIAGLVPWLITHWRVQPETPVMSLVIGAAMAAAGLAMVVESFVRFARTGGGTPAPVAPTERLVVTGLYRYVRNPMYVGVLLLIFWSLRSGQYEDLQGAGERIFVDEDGDCAGSHHTLSDVPAPPAVEAAGHPPHDETPAGRGDRRPHFG